MTQLIQTFTERRQFPDLDPVCIEIVKMQKSWFISVDRAEDTGPLEHLTVAMPTRYDKYSAATTLIANTVDNQGETIARRLSTIFNDQVALSLNVTKDVAQLAPYLEVELVSMLRALRESTTEQVDR
jgi:hypothetical protein